MVILGGRMGGAVGVSTLGGWAEVCTGGSVVGGIWAITLGAAGGFTLGAGWGFCSTVEDGGIGGGGLVRKMSQMRVRYSNRLV